MPCHWFEHESGFQLDDQCEPPIVPVSPLFNSRDPTRHDAGSWPLRTEQHQVLPLQPHIPQLPGRRPLPLPCWSPCPVAPLFRRSRCNCTTPCHCSHSRRPTRTMRPRRRTTMLGRTGILSECHIGHHTSIMQDPVALTFPNRGIPSHTCRDKDITLGTAAQRHTTYPLGFRCPLRRPFPQAHMRRTTWAAIITTGNRCIRRIIINHRCLPTSSRARHKDLKGYRHIPTNTRIATMAKANRIHPPILAPLFLAHINSMVDRGNLIHLMPKTHLRVTVLLVVLH